MRWKEENANGTKTEGLRGTPSPPPLVACWLRGQAGEEGDAGGGQPGGAVDEPTDGELRCFLLHGDDAVARPVDPQPHGGAVAGVPVLAVVQSIDGEVAVPLEPAGGVDVAGDVGEHEDGAGVGLPGPAEEGGVAAVVAPLLLLRRREFRRGKDPGDVDGDAGVLVGVLPALGGDGVLLFLQRPAGVEGAVLQHHGGVAEDEVDGAGDGAVAVELPLRVHVECVLVAQHVAARHRLVLRRPRRVLESHVPRHEPRPHRRCDQPERKK
ncbi:unnamed protein product [Spirodela intermedia]|uniref:Uncharacterized protein n=1 Tax=Spirodela intermedia TaxID=51605 RepID=A0A7I8KJP5_SPIIN|nr:unnamed protein product [Spirodela intermedia]